MLPALMGIPARLTTLAMAVATLATNVGTLLSRLTIGRASALDSLPTVAAQTAALDARLSQSLINHVAGIPVSVIKRIQTGTIDIVEQSMSVGTGVDTRYFDITISSVVVGKSFPHFQAGSLVKTITGRYSTLPTVRLVNATTLRVAVQPDDGTYWGAFQGISVNGVWTVVEYN